MTYEITKYHGDYNISGRSSSVKYILVHYVGAGDSSLGNARNNCIYFAGGNRNASAHYFIDDGSIYEYADPWSYSTWHCGDGGGRYGITNQNSIGIEVCNNGGPFTDAEISRLSWLVQKLMADFGVDAAHVVRHYDASRKQCPIYYVQNPSEWTKLHSTITEDDMTPEEVAAAVWNAQTTSMYSGGQMSYGQILRYTNDDTAYIRDDTCKINGKDAAEHVGQPVDTGAGIGQRIAWSEARIMAITDKLDKIAEKLGIEEEEPAEKE